MLERGLHQPLTGTYPPKILQEWRSRDGVPCRIEAQWSCFAGLIQLSDPVLQRWPKHPGNEEALILGLGLYAGPDEEGWIGFHAGRPAQVWDIELVRQHLPPAGARRALHRMGAFRGTSLAEEWNLHRLRAATESLAAKFAEVSHRVTSAA